ncbi:hypothetical protein Q4555_11710 [Octadecabacter sp. 1_MG-2023]|uniref:hypothetical protein n=1 Tax=unclassified Octadecabacter TaxID=196158 RepID=UPI001C085B1A|nr:MULTISPECIES: hypothetical protein [unclassified Octadecabacter]MBU2993819.1 hypothetical protein [Octadecabacter sp. B2R22]MDO6735335.1 hypothetical protein [Octadecabacter sp. 1_MG-2023]
MFRTALVLSVAATSAFAQGASEANIAAMVAAIEDAGCVVTADNGDAVHLASGLTEDETMAVVLTMYADGMVALEEDGTMSLFTEACP